MRAQMQFFCTPSESICWAQAWAAKWQPTIVLVRLSPRFEACAWPHAAFGSHEWLVGGTYPERVYFVLKDLIGGYSSAFQLEAAAHGCLSALDLGRQNECSLEMSWFRASCVDGCCERAFRAFALTLRKATRAGAWGMGTGGRRVFYKAIRHTAGAREFALTGAVLRARVGSATFEVDREGRQD